MKKLDIFEDQGKADQVEMSELRLNDGKNGTAAGCGGIVVELLRYVSKYINTNAKFLF